MGKDKSQAGSLKEVNSVGGKSASEGINSEPHGAAQYPNGSRATGM
jgi:hypothetical protein